MVEGALQVRTAETPVVPPGRRWRAIGRFAISVACAGALSVWLARALRRPLRLTTDIVGYTIHANFNSFNYFTQYYVAVLFFPLVSLLIYEFVGRIWRQSSWPPVSVSPVPAASSKLRSVTERIAPSLAVGLSVGGVWLVCGPSAAPRDLGIAVALSLVYVGLIASVAAVLARRWSVEPAAVHAVLNAGIAPFSLLLVQAVSRGTWVRVQTPESIHHYNPVPTGVTLLLVAVAVVVAWSRLLRARGLPALRRIERQVVTYVTIPGLLFVFTAGLMPPLGEVDLFHDGELTGAANIVFRGAFPWRDVVFIHGLLHDVLTGLLGFKVFGHTIWGASVAYSFFLAPACWIAFYLLFVYLFPGRFSIVLAALAVPFTSSFAHLHFRFLPYPLILLALGAVLRLPSWGTAFALALGLVAGNILVPEMAYAIPACIVVLAAYDWSHRGASRSLTSVFTRTSKVFVWGVALSAAWALFLLRHDALGSFIDYYLTFVPGHELTGAIPIGKDLYKDKLFMALMLLPPVLIVLAVWGWVATWRSGGHLDDRDWVMIAATIVTFAYYGKFLSRPDWHVTHSFAPAIPLFFYTVNRILDAVKRLVPNPWAEWVPAIGATVLAVALVSGSPREVLARVSGMRNHFQLTVPHEPLLARIGWSTDASAGLAADTRSLEQFLASQLGPSDSIFDFTNQPALYHFLLDLKPASRFFHVSMAIRPAAQKEVISDLKRSRPRLVVFQSETGGLGPWDGIPNEVRHHEISRFILDHYRPLASVAGQTFFIEKSLAPAAVGPEKPFDTREAYLVGQQCDWGYAPNFLHPGPMVRGLPATRRSSSKAARLEARGWAIKADRSAPAAAVIATEGQRVVGRVKTGLPRPDVAAIYGEATRRSGFQLLSEWEPVNPGDSLRLFGISPGGEADELPMGVVPGGPPEFLRIAGSVVPVVAGSVRGYVDMVVATREQVTEFDLPPDLSVRELAGVEIEARARQAGTVAISAAPSSLGAASEDAREVRGIVLRVPRSRTVRLRVELDNCPAWRVASGTRLYVKADEGVEVDSLHPLMRAEQGVAR